jgi:hypothetical protein
VWTQAWQETPAKKCDNWVRCSAVKKLIPFNALVYSADVLIPVIDLKQRVTWAPMAKRLPIQLPHFGTISVPRLGAIQLDLGTVNLPHWTVRALVWAENILGSFGILLYGALISGVIKRD